MSGFSQFNKMKNRFVTAMVKGGEKQGRSNGMGVTIKR